MYKILLENEAKGERRLGYSMRKKAAVLVTLLFFQAEGDLNLNVLIPRISMLKYLGVRVMCAIYFQIIQEK